jgi:hypothetical protein
MIRSGTWAACIRTGGASDDRMPAKVRSPNRAINSRISRREAVIHPRRLGQGLNATEPNDGPTRLSPDNQEVGRKIQSLPDAGATIPRGAPAMTRWHPA